MRTKSDAIRVFRCARNETVKSMLPGKIAAGSNVDVMGEFQVNNGDVYCLVRSGDTFGHVRKCDIVE